MEFLQKTKGIQYVDLIWLNSVLILTKTGCVRESLYQSTTIIHPVLSLKSDRTGVSHRHWSVHYVVVFSHSLPYLPCLSDWYLTQFLSWDYDSDTITSFYFSLRANPCLTLASGWGLPQIGWTLCIGGKSLILSIPEMPIAPFEES